jgi:hypothetical protein
MLIEELRGSLARLVQMQNQLRQRVVPCCHQTYLRRGVFMPLQGNEQLTRTAEMTTKLSAVSETRRAESKI